MKKLLLLYLIIILSCNILAQDVTEVKNPWQISGSASFGSSYYGITGLENRQRPLGYFVNINLNPKVYNLSLPFSITINQQQTRFTQPFNRFGISPKYKWVTVHAGHRNLYFSDFTLSGVTLVMAPKKTISTWYIYKQKMIPTV